MRVIAAFLVSLGLVACAATLPTMQDTTPIKSELLLDHAKPFPGAATVHILRDGAFAGGAVAYSVYVDDRLVGPISVEERMTLYLTAGERAIMIRNPLPAVLSGAPASIVQTFSSGSVYYFRFSAGSGGGSTLQRVTAASVKDGPQ